MRSRAARAAAIALALAALHPRAARAQAQTGFGVSRFEPAERGSRWFVADSLAFEGRMRPAVGATLDYAYKPLVTEDERGIERFALVRHQLWMHAGASLVITDRVRVGVDLPFALYQDGESGRASGALLKGASAPALGDIRLAGDVRLAGVAGSAFVLAAGARIWLPTGVRSQFTGDGSLRISPQLLAAGEVGPLSWAARVAFVYRARNEGYAGAALGSELHAAGGVGVALVRRRLFVGPEVYASTVVVDAFGASTTPADVVLGAHVDVMRGLSVSVGGGAGVTPGYGAPAARGLFAVEWSEPFERGPADADHDGIRDEVDACPAARGPADDDPTQNGCPSLPPPPPEDADGDGVDDTDDACPTVPGLRSSDVMTNGCPVSEAPRPLAVLTKTEIRIAEQIPFATDSAEIAGQTDVLGAVERLMREHPDIRKVVVEGHTDAAGDAAYNEDLSARRAAAVVAWLVEHGVDPRRLESRGMGSRRPLASNATEDGRAKNRRVVFSVVERAPR